MEKIKLIADSTCDLSQEVLNQYQIDLAPLTITIEGKVYRDRVDINPDTFYAMLETLSTPPQTSMPNPTAYREIIDGAILEGYTHILCICMSSGTSAAYQSAVLARDDFYEHNPDSPITIHVVDSKSMSHGSGWLILKSARMREKGATFKELVAFNETYKTQVKHFLSVDDLNHLIRSGRISNTSAFFGKLFNVKPIMTMKNAKGAIVGKERGRRGVMQHYVKEFLKRNDSELTDFIIIGYTSDLSYGENLKNKLREETSFSGEIYVMQMGVAVGTHVGPGAVSMFFMEKRKR